jgi:type VI secretion system protein ImpD
MNCEEFSFIGEDAVISNNTASDIFENSALLERFLNEKETFKALLLWLEGSSDSPLQWDKESISSYLQLTIVKIDSLISKQLDQILHHPKLQQLEASWRNLWCLS